MDVKSSIYWIPQFTPSGHQVNIRKTIISNYGLTFHLLKRVGTWQVINIANDLTNEEDYQVLMRKCRLAKTKTSSPMT